jgi:hypothetical protein
MGVTINGFWEKSYQGRHALDICARTSQPLTPAAGGIVIGLDQLSDEWFSPQRE